MKLFHTPHSCSVIPLAISKELNIDLEVVLVNLQDKTLADGTNYNEINPKGYVPALELDNGEVLTELSAICLYLGSLKDNSLLQQSPSLEYFKTIEWFNFLATELHKCFKPKFKKLFGAPISDDWLKAADEDIYLRLSYVESVLTEKNYVLGQTASLADFYLFAIIGWAKKLQLDLSSYEYLHMFYERMLERESVKTVML